MVNNVPELNKYFPDFKDKKKWDRKCVFQILTTMSHDELSSMIRNAKKNRFLLENNDEDETILIHKSLLEEINSVMTQKRKMILLRRELTPWNYYKINYKYKNNGSRWSGTRLLGVLLVLLDGLHGLPTEHTFFDPLLLAHDKSEKEIRIC